jgi:hypothetical protein
VSIRLNFVSMLVQVWPGLLHDVTALPFRPAGLKCHGFQC